MTDQALKELNPLPITIQHQSMFQTHILNLDNVASR